MPKILIIEDNQTMCEAMQEILQREGYVVEISFLGMQGIQMFEQKPYDLIFCDMRLGDVSGLDVLAKHQALSHQSKFVFITAFGNIELAVDCIKKGAHDFIAKPFSPDALRQKAKAYLHT